MAKSSHRKNPRLDRYGQCVQIQLHGNDERIALNIAS